jgi:hypothetical protein
MQRQLDLFGARRVGFDASFAELRRDELADAAWVDHAPGWVRGHDALFDELEASLEWRTEKRRMYDRHVMTPRLLAGVPTTAVAGGAIEDMRRALSERSPSASRASSCCAPPQAAPRSPTSSAVATSSSWAAPASAPGAMPFPSSRTPPALASPSCSARRGASTDLYLESQRNNALFIH